MKRAYIFLRTFYNTTISKRNKRRSNIHRENGDSWKNKIEFGDSRQKRKWKITAAIPHTAHGKATLHTKTILGWLSLSSSFDLFGDLVK